MSFLKKITEERNIAIYFLSSKTGLKFYAYVLVPVAKSNDFEKSIESGALNINDYGAVIDFHIGVSEPDEDSKADIKKFLESFKSKLA